MARLDVANLRKIVFGEGVSLIDWRDHTIVDPKQRVPFRDSGKPGAIKRIVIHSTDADGWSPERLSRFFVEERGFPICGYHYYVTKSTIYHMVGDGLVGYHAAGYSSTSIGISMDFAPTKMEKLNVSVDPETYESCKKMAALVAMKYGIHPDNIVFHRELFGTGFFLDKNDRPHLRKICPGLSLEPKEFRFDVVKIMQTTYNAMLLDGETPLAVDGVFGNKTREAMSEVSFV